MLNLLNWLKDVALCVWEWLKCMLGQHEPERRTYHYLWMDEPKLEMVCRRCERELTHIVDKCKILARG